ncbi:MAG: cellulase family glycosylhydrolase [Paludibacter sp.]|nr:cellulase family glycosylhydrolase [Paludibacter sp.]
MKSDFLVVFLMYSVFLAAQNHFPELDPPPTTFGKNATKAVTDYSKLDSMYSKLVAQPWMIDEYNRHFIPNGVVIVTEDALGDLPDLERSDYQKMRNMGFNVQVIRLCLTRIGGWPGSHFRADFFKRVDRHILFAKENGIKTMFKLTLYDLTKESYGALKEEQWIALLNNENGTRDKYIEAWSNVFQRYKNEPAVIGYDLLNEPLASEGFNRQYPWVLFPEIFKDIPTFEKKFFIPLYNEVVSNLNKMSPEKYALIQWWHHIPPEHRKTGLPSAPVSAGVKGKNIFYAPHYYGTEPSVMMERYLKDALVMNAPIIIPEYGAPVFNVTDTNIETQLLYQYAFIRSLDLYDRYCVGLVKAWWCGSAPLYEKKADRTWAMFEGRSHARGPERKYVTDLMCRPRPMAVDGVVNSFHYDFATRVFTMDFISGKGTAVSEIYLPVNRHYPDGCRIQVAGIEMTILPDNRMIVSGNKNSRIIDMFHWDSDRQQLLVKKWPENNTRLLLKIVPGVQD